MNDVHLFRRQRAVDFSRLNDAERRVLKLLAEGHTAKSIADAIGSSATAVNERLREARRKTGVGSSRELARLLKAQENGHEQMVMGRRSHSGSALSRLDAEPWRPQMGVSAMIAIFLICVAGAAALVSQGPAIESKIDPLIGVPLERSPEPVELHARIRAEVRDPLWAQGMERQIRARLMRLPLIGKDGNVLRIICARTLCEIAGTVRASKSEVTSPNSQANHTILALQTPPVTEELIHLGLKMELGSFLGGKAQPDRTLYLIYYSRVQPVHP